MVIDSVRMAASVRNSTHKMLYNILRVMSAVISACLACLWDQIRWISRSLTQMFISLSGVSYVSRCRLKLAELSESLAWGLNAAGRRLQYSTVSVCVEGY